MCPRAGRNKLTLADFKHSYGIQIEIAAFYNQTIHEIADLAIACATAAYQKEKK